MDGSKVSTFLSPTKTYLGVNSHKKLSEIIGEWGIKKLFFLCDGGVIGSEVFKSVENILRENHVKFEIFTDIEPDPSAKTVEKAYNRYRTIEASAVLALGVEARWMRGKQSGFWPQMGGASMIMRA